MAQYWLMKSEPDVFSIDHLKKDKSSIWDGVRNYQARNFMVKDMKVGDSILFYHSNADPPGVAGLAKVSQPAKPDPTAFDKKSKYFDEKSTKEKPRWYCVTIKYEKKFKHFVSLVDIRKTTSLQKMALLMRGQRLSIQPVDQKHFDIICKMGGV
jgi:predicted RNA-binding protein with PUA-like domain